MKVYHRIYFVYFHFPSLQPPSRYSRGPEPKCPGWTGLACQTRKWVGGGGWMEERFRSFAYANILHRFPSFYPNKWIFYWLHFWIYYIRASNFTVQIQSNLWSLWWRGRRLRIIPSHRWGCLCVAFFLFKFVLYCIRSSVRVHDESTLSTIIITHKTHFYLTVKQSK